MPSAAGSKRAQPEYPTQEDVAALPPLKRIKADTSAHVQPFAFDFQHAAQAAAVRDSNIAASPDTPFIFSASTQAQGQNQPPGQNQSLGLNPYVHSQQYGASAFGVLPPPQADPSSQGVSPHNPYASLPFSQPYTNPFASSVPSAAYSQHLYTNPFLDPARAGEAQSVHQHQHAFSNMPSMVGSITNRESPSVQGLNGNPSYPSSSLPPPLPDYSGLAPPYPLPSDHAASSSYLSLYSQPQISAASAYTAGMYLPASNAAYAPGVTYPPPYPMPYPAMHPMYAAYAAQAAHANLARMQADGQPQNAAVPMPYSYPAQYPNPHQHTQPTALNTLDGSSLVPPPPPLYPPPFPPC